MTGLASARMLFRHQSQPGGKVPCLAECLGRRSKNRNGRGDQGTDAGHRHQPPGHFVLLGPTGDLAIELADSSHYDPVAAPQANARTAAFFKQQL